MISPVGVACAFAAILCWSVSSMCFEHAGRVVGSMAVNIIRLWFAFFFLGIPLMAMQGSASPVPIELTSEQWTWFFVSGLLGFFLSDLFLFRAFVVLGPRLTMLIMALCPIFCALIEWAFQIKPYLWYQYIGMAITISGIAWVILEQKSRGKHKKVDQPDNKNGLKFKQISTWGVACAVIGSLGQAFGLVCAGIVMTDAPPEVALGGTQVRVIAGIFGFVILFTLIRQWPVIFDACKRRRIVILIATGAFFGPSLGMVLMILSLKYLPAGISMTIGALMPLVLIPPAIFINKEHVTPRAIFGAMVAVGGVIILVGSWGQWLESLCEWF